MDIAASNRTFGRIGAWVVPALTIFVLGVGALFPDRLPVPDLTRPSGLALLAALGVATSLVRPGGGLAIGLGAVVLPPIIFHSGATAAALLAAAIVLLQFPVVAVFARLCGAISPRAPHVAVVAGRAAAALLAAFAAGWAWKLLSAPGEDSPGLSLPIPALLTATVVFVAAGIALARLADRYTSTGGGRSIEPTVAAAATTNHLFEAGGWLVGLILTRVQLWIEVAVAPQAARGFLLMMLLALAALAAEAGRNRLLYEGAKELSAGIDRVRWAGHRIVTGAREMAGVVERIRTECARVVPFSWFHFEVVAPRAKAYSLWSGPSGELAEGTPRPPTFPPPLPGLHKRTSWLRVDRQLIIGGGPVARLRLWSDPRVVDEGQVEALDSLLPQMAASVQRALLDREAREDPLTGVAVRRVLERRLETAFAASRESGEPVAVIMCDLDKFKDVNDTYGHAVGDRALVEAARALDTHRREGDLLVRYGGEEFALLLENTEGTTALRVSERLRQAIQEVELREGEETIPLTLSAGVAASPDLFVADGDELLLLADAALYEAKRQGRNRSLLDLGNGQFADGDGRLYRSEKQRAEPGRPPQIFA